MTRGSCSPPLLVPSSLPPHALRLREFPRPAIFAAQMFVGFGVFDDLFFRAVPLKAASELEREHSEQGDVCRIVEIFDVADGLAAVLDRVEEVGPKFFDVLVI